MPAWSWKGLVPLCLILGTPVAAPASPRIVRWPDLAARVDTHPSLAEAKARVDAARGAIVASGEVPNPTLDVGAGAGWGTSGDRRPEWQVALSVPFDWVARRGPRQEAARAEADAAAQDVEVLRRTVLAEVFTLFWGAVFDRALIASLEETAAQADRVAALVRRRVQTGEARPIEVPRAETDVERARLDLSEARIREAARLRLLRLWLANAPEASLDVEVDGIVVEGDLATPPPLPALEALLAGLAARHPDLQAARSRVAARAAEVAVEERARVPSFEVKGYVEHELDRTGAGASLSLEIPLWNWNQGGIARAEAARGAEARRLDVRARELRREAIEAHARCAQAREASSRFRDGILPRALEAVTTLERSFEIGEAGLLDLLDARRVLADVRRQALGADLRQQLDCGALRILAGEAGR